MKVIVYGEAVKKELEENYDYYTYRKLPIIRRLKRAILNKQTSNNQNKH